MLVVAISPQQMITGLVESMYHAHTPHSNERFERDRRPMLRRWASLSGI